LSRIFAQWRVVVSYSSEATISEIYSTCYQNSNFSCLQ